ncbi:MAG: metal ABC transporter substrate-binding protein [Candidatus Manganitrophus sp.]|nr:MAG: metal ABC transporter substrate-binding protein [Candidatus Manganitrophus sp.]
MISKILKAAALVMIFLLAPASAGFAEKPLSMVVTIPDFGWAAQKIGGEYVQVRSLLDGSEDPHFLDATPKFISWVADADIVCFGGLDLEVGWLPKVLAKSGNAKVQQGGKGYCEMGKEIEVLERPTGPVDRSLGDVHPFGNPHFWLSPKRLAQGSKRIAMVLADERPDLAETFFKNYEALQKELDQILKENKDRLDRLIPDKNKPLFVEYHGEFTYFAADYGLNEYSKIEEKPGVPPSAGRLAKVALDSRSHGIRFALAATFDPRHLLKRFEELSGVPVLIVPAAIQTKGPITTYPQLQKYLVDQIESVLKSPAAGK